MDGPSNIIGGGRDDGRGLERGSTLGEGEFEGALNMSKMEGEGGERDGPSPG